MRTDRFRRTAVAVVAGGALLALAGCNGAELPGYGSGVSTAGPDETTATPSDQGTAPLVPSTEDSTGEASDGALLTVTDVRVIEQDGSDRVELELEGEGTPGWHVGYVEEALDEGKGDPVEVDGHAILQVHVTGTAMPMDSGVTEYDGTTVPGPEGGAVTEVVYRFVYEGTTTAFVGVADQPRPFAVSAAEDPTRIVIDVSQ
jgi:hypothetical protein